jgi:hypothetical protein
MNDLSKLSILFCAGLVAGIVNALFVWGMGASGINTLLGIQIVPALTPAFLYQKMVWGGIWGFIFLLPFLKDSIWRRGFLFGLAPTFVVLFVVLPLQAKKGLLGLQLGAMVPLFAIVANTFWGVTAAFWIKLCLKS